MIHVRRHIRITASGKHAAVRAHERDIDPDPQREVPGWVQPPYVGEPVPVADEQGTSPEFREMFLDDSVDEDIWDGDAIEVGDHAVACPECGLVQPVNLGGTLAGHRVAGDDNYCPGSGTAC